MSTLNQFLSEISNFVKAKDGQKLESYLAIGPNFNPEYHKIIQELRSAYPKGSEDKLEDQCGNLLSDIRDGWNDEPSWGAFIKFISQYCIYLRDLDQNNILQTYTLLSELVQKCNSSLTNASHGVLMLQTTVVYSKSMAHFALLVDKNPDMLLQIRSQLGTTESGLRETLPEKAANIIRQAFVACLNDRMGSPSGVKDGRPEGKKAAIYALANVCLKVLFHCGKFYNAEQIFVNIYNQSPPLAVYPKSEQVKFLYYLGRFNFDNSHFGRAMMALDHAYNLCLRGPQTIKQRRLILIQLIATNIILGRFPNENLYQKPEAAGLQEVFHPICLAISMGDLGTFQKLLDFDGPSFKFLWYHKVFMQMQCRCEVLVWRSLIRKSFLVAGDHGDASSKKAPTLGLKEVSTIFKFLDTTPDDDISEDQWTEWAELEVEKKAKDPELTEKLEIMRMESILTSLIHQGYVNGYLSHKTPVRLAIQGAKTVGALSAGFPPPWEVVKTRIVNDEVPGWKKTANINQGGRVVQFGAGKLTGVGAAAFG